MKKAVSKILILIIIAILIAGGFFVWKKWGKSKSKPESKLPPGIEVIEQGDKKIVRNTVEGYELTVPKEWRVGAKMTNRLVVEMPADQAALEVASPAVIINVFNLEKEVDFDMWLKDKINRTETPACFKDRGKIKINSFILHKIEDICQYGAPIVEYYFKKDLTIYSFIDDMAGEERVREIITSIKF